MGCAFGCRVVPLVGLALAAPAIAQTADPDPAATRKSIALAEQHMKLGRYDEAARQLRAVVARGGRADLLTRAHALLDAALLRVGVVTLTVEPDGVAIMLGGVELGSSPLPEPLVLMPGTYTLAFSAPGYRAEETELQVEPGTTGERTIALAAIEPVRPAPLPVIESRTDNVGHVVEPPTVQLHARPPRGLLITGAAITGAAAIGAGVLGALALREHAAFTDASSTAAERSDARDRGERLALATDVSIATAVVAASFTAYWYFYRYRPRVQAHAAVTKMLSDTKVSAYPWVQAESGGIVLAGWF